jgi:hypothetical protein
MQNLSVYPQITQIYADLGDYFWIEQRFISINGKSKNNFKKSQKSAEICVICG